MKYRRFLIGLAIAAVMCGVAVAANAEPGSAIKANAVAGYVEAQLRTHAGLIATVLGTEAFLFLVSFAKRRRLVSTRQTSGVAT